MLDEGFAIYQVSLRIFWKVSTCSWILKTFRASNLGQRAIFSCGHVMHAAYVIRGGIYDIGGMLLLMKVNREGHQSKAFLLLEKKKEKKRKGNTAHKMWIGNESKKWATWNPSESPGKSWKIRGSATKRDLEYSEGEGDDGTRPVPSTSKCRSLLLREMEIWEIDVNIAAQPNTTVLYIYGIVKRIRNRVWSHQVSRSSPGTENCKEKNKHCRISPKIPRRLQRYSPTFILGDILSKLFQNVVCEFDLIKWPETTMTVCSLLLLKNQWLNWPVE